MAASVSSKSISKWDTESCRSTLTTANSTVSRPPFALDQFYEDDLENGTVSSRMNGSTLGYRTGGPKEARLHRVALLAKTKEVDHLHPIKVLNLPKSASPQKLAEAFGEFGEIGDIYIPMNYKENEPKGDFAIVRYKSSDSVDKLLPDLRALSGSPEPCSPTTTISSPTTGFVPSPSSPFKVAGGLTLQSRPMTSDGRPVTIDNRPITVSPVEKQRSFFTNGTGYHGFCNEVVEDGTYNRDPVLVQQDVELASCMSRSGYPWGSVRELKYLAPHLPTDIYDAFAIKIENLAPETTAQDIKVEFERRYHNAIINVNCPKPIVVTELIKGPNNGFAFVRFDDRRDRDRALHDVNEGKFQFQGRVITGQSIKPGFWPKESTRRYY